MSSFSTTDELEAIERAARGDLAESAQAVVLPAVSSKGTKKDDARRGSSMFANNVKTEVKFNGTGGDKKYGGDDLLVDFPHSDDESEDYDDDDSGDDELPPSAQRPRSVSSGMKRGIEDFDDDPRDGRRELPGAPMPGSSGPRPPPGKNVNAPATGSQNYRPMVGGFAAAAYEAAREYHYQSHARQDQQNYPKRTGPPPSI